MMLAKDKGENNLHAHPDTDSTWLVLRGKAHFYGMNDEFVGEIGPAEGVAIPKGVPYWFENKGEEPLEIFHITARDMGDPAVRRKEFHRVNYAPYTAGQTARGEKPGRMATEEERKAAAELS